VPRVWASHCLCVCSGLLALCVTNMYSKDFKITWAPIAVLEVRPQIILDVRSKDAQSYFLCIVLVEVLLYRRRTQSTKALVTSKHWIFVVRRHTLWIRGSNFSEALRQNARYALPEASIASYYNFSPQNLYFISPFFSKEFQND